MIYDAPDWAPPFGIARPVAPPDDAITEAQCALAGAVEHAYLDLQLAGHDALPVTAIPDDFSRRRPVDLRPDPSAGRSDAGGRPPAGRPLHSRNHTHD